MNTKVYHIQEKNKNYPSPQTYFLNNSIVCVYVRKLCMVAKRYAKVSSILNK